MQRPSHTNPFVVTPPSVPPLPLQPASFGRRASALALDHVALLLCLLPGFVAVNIFGLVANSYPLPPDTEPAELFSEIVMEAMPVFLGGLLAGALLQLGLLAFQSRSIGKRWMGLRIVRMDGRPAGALRLIFVRTPVQMLNYLPFLSPILLIVNLVLSLRPPHWSVHDRVAGTQVVRG
jgi:uncharacterized RDD family membrane protein YckC